MTKIGGYLDWVPVILPPAAFLVVIVISASLEGPSNLLSIIVPVGTITAAALGGLLAGGYRGWLSYHWLCKRYCFKPQELAHLENKDERDSLEGHFLSTVMVSICLYLGVYALIMARISDGKYPSDWNASILSMIPILPTIAANGLAIGLLCFFAVRFAAFNRLLVFVDLSVRTAPPDPTQWRELTDRLCVFARREEAIHEPPGNIFVTIGIGATFLGLAAGLATLNVKSLLDSAGAMNRDALLTALGLMIRFMSLGLFISLLGVVIAVAAQWLRGHGPALTTEELFKSARGARSH